MTTVVLVCTNPGCRGPRSKVVEDRPVGGLPLQAWFNGRGRLCSECYARAGGAMAHAQALQQPTVPKAASIQERFEAFHQLNPWVYDALEELTEEWVRNGHRRIGIGMLFEVLRWQYGRMTVDPASEFKLNNNYRSRYTRLLTEQRPEWADVFETRQLQAS